LRNISSMGWFLRRLGMLLFRSITLIILSFSPYLAKAQVPADLSSLVLSKKTKELIDQKQFENAIPYLKELLTRFPKDALQHYYYGVCMIETGADLNTALDYLSFCEGYDVPVDIYYYIGLAHHRLYQFDAALKNYQMFKLEGAKSSHRDISINKEIKMLEFAPGFMAEVYKPKVTQKILFKSNDSIALLYAANGFSISVKPRNLMSALDISSGERFYYCDAPNNEYLYFSGFGNSKNKGKDIFRIKKTELNNGNPENIGSPVNTSGDEDFPFFDSKTSTLYFSSRGDRLGLGAYDIYKSVFNQVKKEWSAPELLPFPVNTVYDDYLYVKDDAGKWILMLSNREGPSEHKHFYQLYAPATWTKQAGMTRSEWLKIQTMAVNTDNVAFAEKANPIKQLVKPDSIINKTQSYGKSTEIEDKAEVVNPLSQDSPIQSKSKEADYYFYINQALTLQVKSDSIQRKINLKREELFQQTITTEKNKIQAEIYKMEKQSAAFQKQADSFYAKARELEPSQSKPVKVKEEIMIQDAAVKKGSKNANSIFDEPAFLFELLSQTPYNSKNLIPIDMPMPSGVVYKIQLGAFSKPIAYDQFKGMKPITGETLQDKVVVKYYVGFFNQYNLAEKAMRQVHDYGYKDAFLVSWYNGAKVPVNRAKQVE